MTARAAGDLDGDGRAEVLAGYRIEAGGEVWGVLVVYGSFEAVYRDRALVAWPSVWPVGLKLHGARVRVALRSGQGSTEQRGDDTLVWGKDLLDGRGPKGALEGVRVEASSTLRSRRAEAKVEALIDGDLATGWAEGAIGTGISERVRLSFAAPVDLALIGVAGGHDVSEEVYRLSNRLRQAEIRVLTSAEIGDPAAGVEYARMGLEFAGHRERQGLPDRPGLTFLPVALEDVVHLEIKVESVYLGDRFDDLWISELVPVRLRAVPALELVGVSVPPAADREVRAAGPAP
jgi:hypothetical protein